MENQIGFSSIYCHSFTITRTLEQGATELVIILPGELFIRIVLHGVNTTRNEKITVQASFVSLFLGDSEKLLNVMKERFPELGLECKDSIELSWIQSVLYLGDFPTEGPLNVLLNRTQSKRFYKVKSDYVQEPIPKIGLEGIWKRLIEEEDSFMRLNPYGGRMNEISEYDIPLPHRAGKLYKILYSYMTPYVRHY